MKFKRIFKNDEAVSISIGFILMFAVTVIVFSALIISFYSLSGHTEKSAMQESFKILGNGLAIKISTMDILVNQTNSMGGTINSLDYDVSIPETIAGRTYVINITDSPDLINLEADNGAKIMVPFNISMNIIPGKIYSGAENYKLYYNKTINSIEIS